VSAHEKPCALNVKKTFDKQKDDLLFFSGTEKNRVYLYSISKKQAATFKKNIFYPKIFTQKYLVQ